MRFRLRTLMIVLALGFVLCTFAGAAYLVSLHQKRPRREREFTAEQLIEFMDREDAERDARRGFIRTDQSSTDHNP